MPFHSLLMSPNHQAKKNIMAQYTPFFRYSFTACWPQSFMQHLVSPAIDQNFWESSQPLKNMVWSTQVHNVQDQCCVNSHTSLNSDINRLTCVYVHVLLKTMLRASIRDQYVGYIILPFTEYWKILQRGNKYRVWLQGENQRMVRTQVNEMYLHTLLINRKYISYLWVKYIVHS